jgi:archaeal flagellin FlaB
MIGTKKGAVGIGTLIIFIAMVLVAAIAAAVLINVSGILQLRAMSTGKEAIAQVSGNIVVVSIIGNTNAELSDIDSLNVTLTAAAGAGRIDLGQMIIKVGNNVNQSILNYSNTATSSTSFILASIRDPTHLFGVNTPVIDGSALVSANIDLTATNPRVSVPARSPYHMEFIPEHGATTIIDAFAPPTYSTSIVALYP